MDLREAKRICHAHGITHYREGGNIIRSVYTSALGCNRLTTLHYSTSWRDAWTSAAEMALQADVERALNAAREAEGLAAMAEAE